MLGAADVEGGGICFRARGGGSAVVQLTCKTAAASLTANHTRLVKKLHFRVWGLGMQLAEMQQLAGNAD